MSLAIVGVGAMASLFAAYLAPYINVAMLGHWPEQLAVLERNGVTLEVGGSTIRRKVFATNDPRQVPPSDMVLILVKSHQTTQAALAAKQFLNRRGLAVTLQNGLGNLEQLTAVLGADRTALGITTHGATMLEPGRVRHAGVGPTHLAYCTEPVERIYGVGAYFDVAGLKTDVQENVRSLVWGKLAVNCGINPLTALLGVPNGFLAEHKPTRQVMMAAARETAVVTQSLGITLPYPDAGQRTLEVAQATATNRSSMLQDVQRGALTEIDAICGAVVEYGRTQNIPTPINAELLRMIKLKETGDWNLETEKALSSLQSLISNLNTGGKP